MEQSAVQFRGQARLPRFASPRCYDLRLAPVLAACAFAGSVAVALNVAAPTRFLILNAANLDVAPGAVSFAAQGPDEVLQPVDVANVPEDEILIIRFIEVLPLGEGTLAIAFQGTLNDKMHGFYRSVYELNGKTKNMAVTQFEPTDARRCFPCWDEPAFKNSRDGGNMCVEPCKEHMEKPLSRLFSKLLQKSLLRLLLCQICQLWKRRSMVLPK